MSLKALKYARKVKRHDALNKYNATTVFGGEKHNK